MPWPLGRLALRAAPQVVRKVQGNPFPPPQWPLPPGTGCLWHGLVGLSRLWKHHWTLPPRWLWSSGSLPLLQQESSHPQSP